MSKTYDSLTFFSKKIELFCMLMDTKYINTANTIF